MVLHLDILCEGVNINESLRVLIWSVRVLFLDAVSGSSWLGEVDFLLVTFDSQLKIFDSTLNNHASGEHSQCYSKVRTSSPERLGFAAASAVLKPERLKVDRHDKKGTEKLAADHLSRLENPELEELDEEVIRDSFPNEHLMEIHVKEPEKDPCKWKQKGMGNKIDDALLAFKIAYKSPIESTPIRIVYRKAWHLPIEMDLKAY
nr:protein NYNRIN-like [Tanacetum cinerariifolium]